MEVLPPNDGLILMMKNVCDFKNSISNHIVCVGFDSFSFETTRCFHLFKQDHNRRK